MLEKSLAEHSGAATKNIDTVGFLCSFGIQYMFEYLLSSLERFNWIFFQKSLATFDNICVRFKSTTISNRYIAVL